MRSVVSRLVALAALLAALAVGGAMAAAAPTDEAAGESASAVAVEALIDEPAAAAAEAIPSDFAAVMGYRPRIRDGLLVDPHGGCSSPVAMPAEFATGCAEHDLGYDLLRYAELTGDEVGGWARTAIDQRLHERMRATCARRVGSAADAVACTAAVGTVDAAVELNSIRQFRATPEETLGSLAVSGVAGAAAVCALGAGWLGIRTRRSGGARRRLQGRLEQVTP